MGGIKLYNNNAKATSKLLSALSSYMFEQECGELKKATPKQIQILQEAKNALADIIKKHGVNKL